MRTALCRLLNFGERQMASLEKWVCTRCGYIYDPEKGDPEHDVTPGTPFDSLPDDWICPICYASKEEFDPY